MMGHALFRSSSGGDFITTSLDGPYLMDINQIGLDVVGEGVGLLQNLQSGIWDGELPVTPEAPPTVPAGKARKWSFVHGEEFKATSAQTKKYS